jgi:nucleotide-binding universal stress UspA family protein
MAGHVLVPYDGSPQSEAAIEHVLAEHGDANRITALYVIDPVAAGYSGDVGFPNVAEEWYQNAKDEGEELVEEAAEVAAESGVGVDTTVEVGRPASEVVEYVEDHDVDHIVMGSHGRTGVSRILLGSVAEEVMRRSPVPVTVVR